MATAVRTVIAIIAGMVASFVLIIGMEAFSAVVHPFPPDFKGTMEEVCAHVARYPPWVLAVAVPAWGIAAFLGTWIANKVGNRGAAIFVGLLLLASVVYNVSKLPYYTWFKVACLVVIPIALGLGILLPRRQKPAVSQAAA